MTGKVKWFNNVKGYGFITNDEGNDIFVHYSGINSEGFKFLIEGDIVDFELGKGKNGREQAVKVTVIERECNNIDIDPREEIVSKIANEFDITIPLLAWSGMELVELKAYYEELKTQQKEKENE